MVKLPSKVNTQLKGKILESYSVGANKKKLGRYDLLISSAGYEQRTYGFVSKVGGSIKAKQALIFVYKPKETELFLRNLENLGTMKDMMKKFRMIDQIMVERVNPADPWKFRKTLLNILDQNGIGSNSKVIVDITSFTRVFLYELLNVLYNRRCQFTICYTEPGNYVRTMSIGVNRLIISPSFIGRPRPDKKTFFLLFLGWETGRSTDTFENFNADDSMAVLGVDPIDKKHLKWQKESFKRNTDLIKMVGELKTAPTLELEGILRFIKDVYDRKKLEAQNNHQELSFSICGFGPKIQNLAIGFFALTHKDVQLVYGAPSYWGSSAYKSSKVPIESREIGRCYIYGPFSREIIQAMIPQKTK